MSLLLLAIGLAHAGIVAEIGPPVETGTAGTWARALPTEDGWRLGIGTAGNFSPETGGFNNLLPPLAQTYARLPTIN